MSKRETFPQRHTGSGPAALGYPLETPGVYAMHSVWEPGNDSMHQGLTLSWNQFYYHGAPIPPTEESQGDKHFGPRTDLKAVVRLAQFHPSCKFASQ